MVRPSVVLKHREGNNPSQSKGKTMNEFETTTFVALLFFYVFVGALVFAVVLNSMMLGALATMFFVVSYTFNKKSKRLAAKR